ncbi:hypothetical protein [Halobacillus naozhouensis]
MISFATLIVAILSNKK